MATIKIDGRMTVKTLKDKFKSDFGLSLRVYVGNNAGRGARFAEDTARVNAVADERESLAALGDFEISDAWTVGEFEKAFQERFDLAVQIADAADAKLVDNGLTLAQAKG